MMALSMLVVFLVLPPYESWAIPLSVMLVVPLGLLGAVGAVMLVVLAQRRVLQGR